MGIESVRSLPKDFFATDYTNLKYYIRNTRRWQEIMVEIMVVGVPRSVRKRVTGLFFVCQQRPTSAFAIGHESGSQRGYLSPSRFAAQ